MKKFLLLMVFPMCLLVQLCACNGVDTPEQESALKLDFGALLADLQGGASVVDIAAVERGGKTVGYIVSLADGSGVTLMNQAEGSVVNGLSEDGENWWFELEGGEKVTLPKNVPAEPFRVEITGDEVELTDGGTVQVKYKVSGASNIEVSMMMGEGWEASLSDSFSPEGTITVQAPDPITTDKVLVSFRDRSGKQVVRALRLTSKSAVKRGNIETYTFYGLNYYSINPDTVDPETAQRRYQEAVDAGIQIMEASGLTWWVGYDWSDEALYALDLAEKVGLKLSLCVDRQVWDTEGLEHFVSVTKDHPALWGYKICDEPTANDYANLLSFKRVINRVDGKHPIYINLRPDGGTFGPAGTYAAANYKEYIDRYFEETEPQFVSFDEYPCFSDWILDKDWYYEIGLIASKAKEYGIDMWAFASACNFTDGWGRRGNPTLQGLRMQHYTNLMYGAQCLEYFVWGVVSVDGEIYDDFDGWPTTPDGDKNPDNETYESIKTLNAEVQNRAFVFDNCDVKWVRFFNDQPRGGEAFDMAQVPDEIVSISSADDLVMSLSENDGGRSEYFCVKTRTHIRPCKVHMRFLNPVQTVERDGSLRTINPGDYDFTIDKGDILIIKTK